MMQIQFAAQSYTSASTPLDAQRCLNFYVEQSPPDAKTKAPVFGCPGMTQFSDCGAGPVYDLRTWNGMLYATTGSGIWTITATGTATQVATFVPAGRVAVSNNTTQIIVVDGIRGWVYAPAGIPNSTSVAAAAGATSITLTSVKGVSSGDPISIQLDSGSTFATTVAGPPVGYVVTLALPMPSSAASGNLVTDANVSLIQIVSDSFYSANTVAYYDTYFVLDKAGTNSFFISAINDGTNYSGLDYASKEESPDQLLAVAAIHEQLILFGAQTTEFWYDTGASNFPFAPIPSTLLQRGIAGPRAMAKEDNTLFFLGDDLIFYRLTNFAPQRVSTHAMESAWQKYAVTSDAFCFSYTFDGHKFVNVVFPTAGACFVLDLSTGLWHERGSWDANNNPLSRWRANCATAAYGHVLVGDAFTGQIGIVDPAAFTEYGNTMQGIITGPPIQKDRKRLFMSGFELDVESGVGTTAGLNPQIVLDWSDDGARTWSSAQLPRSMGVQGDYQQRLRWLKLGQFRNRTLRLTVTDPVRRNLIGFYASIKEGLA